MKNQSTKFFLLAVVLFFMASISFGQNMHFQMLPGLNGGYITAIDNVGTTTLYAGTSVGIYRSDDHGTSWKRELSGVRVNKIVVYSKEQVYAATNSGLYLRSGKQWNEIAFSGKKVTDIGITASGMIFVSVEDHGYTGILYKGNTSGNTFTEVTTLGYVSTDYTIACSGDSTVLVDLSLSSDGGQTWMKIDSTFPQFRSVRAPALDITDSILIVGTDNGVFRYDFQKKQWDDLHLLEAFNTIDMPDRNHILAATFGGVYRSSDQGDKWQQLNGGLSSAVVKDVCVAGDRIFAATINGLDASTFSGTSWSPADNGIHEVKTYALAFYNGKLLASTSKGLLITEDDGTEWSPARRMDYYGANFEWPVKHFVTKQDNSLVYAATHGGLFFSGNGLNWNNYGGYVGQQVNDLYIEPGGALIKAADDGVFKSTDDGFTWTKLNENQNLEAVTCVVEDGGGNIYAGTVSGMYELPAKGTKWNEVSSDSISKITFNKLLFDNDNIFAATSKGVLIYNVFYNNWSQSNTGMKMQWVYDITRDAKGDFYASTPSGIYHSNDNCKTWSAVDMGDAPVSVSCVAFDPEGNLYFGATTGGIYTSKESLTGIGRPERVDFSLKAFPNPFVSHFRISYTIPESYGKSEVTVSLLNELGQKIRVLESGSRLPGTYQLSLQGAGLAPGVYFLRLKVGNVSSERKIIKTESYR